MDSLPNTKKPLSFLETNFEVFYINYLSIYLYFNVFVNYNAVSTMVVRQTK